MVIHFFKNRNERIDFEDLIDNYFNTLDNVTITSDDSECRITINMVDFNFAYHYLITKRSHVSSIYKLSYDYVNVNMLIDIPLNIPQFLIKAILQQVDEMCKRFGFSIYYEQLDNIREFRFFEVFQSILKERKKYFEDNPDLEYYKIPEEKLNKICIYQKIMKDLPHIVNADVMSNPYIVMVNKETGKVELSINWRVGEATVFPPELSYVHVEEEENLINLIPMDIFMKYVAHYMYEIKDSASKIKMLFLNQKYSTKARKYLKKMKKYLVSSSRFEIIKFINLIEE